MPLLANVFWGFSLEAVAIRIVIVAAIIAIVCIALAVFNITIPSWVKQMFWVVVVCFVAILAIRLIATM